VTPELSDAFLAALADRLAPLLAERLVLPAGSPWMTLEEAVSYTRLPVGTFRKLSAAGAFTAHGGKRKLYHREELDAALSRSRVPAVAVGTIR
jgi:hypothetical protein